MPDVTLSQSPSAIRSSTIHDLNDEVLQVESFDPDVKFPNISDHFKPHIEAMSDKILTKMQRFDTIDQDLRAILQRKSVSALAYQESVNHLKLERSQLQEAERQCASHMHLAHCPSAASASHPDLIRALETIHSTLEGLQRTRDGLTERVSRLADCQKEHQSNVEMAQHQKSQAIKDRTVVIAQIREYLKKKKYLVSWQSVNERFQEGYDMLQEKQTDRGSSTGLESEVWDPPLLYKSIDGKRNVVEMTDQKRLEKGSQLNDNLINFYLTQLYLLASENTSANRDIKVYVFSTYFFASLIQRLSSDQIINFDAVKKQTSGINLFTYRYLLVPIHEVSTVAGHLNHWYMTIVCNLDKLETEYSDIGITSVDHELTILILDSMGQSTSRTTYRELQTYIREAWKTTKGSSFDQDIKHLSVSGVPIQNNSTDCGLYLLAYADVFFADPYSFFKMCTSTEDIGQDMFWKKVDIVRVRDDIRHKLCTLHAEQESLLTVNTNTT